MPPTFSLLYTTARPAYAESVIAKWLKRAGLSVTALAQSVEVVLTVDSGQEEHLGQLQQKFPQLKVGINHGNKDCVTGWNLAASLCTGKAMLTVSDDFTPPDGWYHSLLRVQPANWLDLECVLAVSDGCNPDIFTISILTRKRYDRFGYVFYPLFESTFCDTEFTQVAVKDEVVLDARHLLFEHSHYSIGKRQQDQVDQTHNSNQRWARGEALYNARMAAGFPLDAGPVAERRVNSKLEFAVVIQAIKDDFCLFEVCDRLLSEPVDETFAIKKVLLFNPDKYWSGASTSKDEAEAVQAVAQQLNAKWPGKAEYIRFSVDKVSHFNQPRIATETDCRNWYQLFLKTQLGVDHAIIADGDELWRRGLLARLVDYVRYTGPNSAFTGMVPVAGLPGVPIDQALDKATIYASTSVRFKECRGAYGFRHELEGHDIYHFTATRRTVDEIIQKHRDSGHYGQEGYEFEAWIQDTLLAGRFKPGQKSMHMYRKPGSQNVWPACRAWRAEEWAELPESVKPYLLAP